MANEISVTVQVQATNGEYVSARIGAADLLDQTTGGFGNPGLVTIGTTAEQISFGDLTPGLVYLKNGDSTNYVTYGGSSGSLPFKLRATSQGLVEMATSGQLWMKADTSSCNCIIYGFNL